MAPRRYGPGDAQIARLLARRGLRLTLYALFLATAAAAWFLRVGEGREIQVLPSWCALLGLHGVLMAMVSRDARVRGAWLVFGILVATAFTRGFLPIPARVLGSLEGLAACALVVLLMRLARDERFLGDAVIEFDAPRSDSIDRTSDESRWPPESRRLEEKEDR